MAEEIKHELSGKELFAIKPTNIALLVIDMQNSFIAPGAVFEAPNGRDIIPNIEKIIKYCRNRGINVI